MAGKVWNVRRTKKTESGLCVQKKMQLCFVDALAFVSQDVVKASLALASCSCDCRVQRRKMPQIHLFKPLYEKTKELHKTREIDLNLIRLLCFSFLLLLLLHFYLADLFFRFTLKPHSGSGLLQRAVKCGATVPHLPRIIAALLHANCDVNGIFDEEGTALHIAALRDLPSVCDTLLKQGANVNAVVEAHVPRMTKTSMAGRTPLFDAVSRRNARVVDVLLRHNADVCHLTDDGMSALHLACSIHTGDDFWPEQSNTVRQLLGECCFSAKRWVHWCWALVCL